MNTQPILIEGQWKVSSGTKTFQAVNPVTREALPGAYPVSSWDEIERAVRAAAAAFWRVHGWAGDRFAAFLDRYATNIEARAADLVAMAHAETALPVEPRLAKAELPRTTNQLRQAAAAARDGSWLRPIIDSAANIRSVFAPIGPVVVFGPNNFPFAFNSIAGGDFAAAVAAGCPVIAKGHSSHPGTTRLFAEAALEAARDTDMPPGFVQLIYRTSHEDGERLVSHPLVGACGYTGARATGLVLKAAADRAGKPIYLELSSINPVFVLPGAIEERAEKIADEFTGSCLMGTGQFCTNPGLVVLLAGPRTEAFIDLLRKRFDAAPVGTLLSEGVLKHLEQGIATLRSAGAEVVAGAAEGGSLGLPPEVGKQPSGSLPSPPDNGSRVCHPNTLLRVTGDQFLAHAAALQTEAFGNSSLLVVARDPDQMRKIAESFEGNLTGGVYSDTTGRDDSLYQQLEPALRHRVGRLLNDKMPTGVAVSPAMNHGGPFPATGHPGFTSVGMPTSIQRFAMLQCYDNVSRQDRLPPSLRDKNPTGKLWRLVNGAWTQGDVV